MPPLPEFALKIAGRAVATRFLETVTHVEVGARRGNPATFTLRLVFDSHRELLESVDTVIGKTLAVGTEIEILHAPSRTRASVLSGIVDTVGLDLDSDGERPPAIVVEGHDKAHLLTLAEKSRVFENMRPSEVAGLIAQEHGLRSTVDSAPQPTFLMQSGETDWAFLNRLAERIGFEVFVAGDKLHFQAVGKRAKPKLTWGSGLVQFQPSITSSRQMVDVTVRGWDPEMKEVVEGKGAAGTVRAGGQVLEVGDRVVRTSDDATRLAQAIAGAIGRSAQSGHGVSQPGKAAIMPGATAMVGGVGEVLGGRYYVAEVTHSFTQEGYSTAFELGERNTVSQGCTSSCSTGDFPMGAVIGIVVDNHDPSNLARVRVQFPWLGGQVESSWARLAVPMAGANRGVLLIPEVGDEVLVAFEHGDFDAPYVVGGLWNGADQPPIQNIDADNNVRLMRSRSGHEVRFDDANQGGGIAIATSNGHTIRLDDDHDQIQVGTGGNGPSILLDADSGAITLIAPSSIVIDSGGDLVLKALGDLTLEAGAQLNATAAASATIEGTSRAELKSAGQVSILGALVTIN